MHGKKKTELKNSADATAALFGPAKDELLHNPMQAKSCSKNS
jgi:hypothetical protein